MKLIGSMALMVALTACGGWHLRGSDSTVLQTNSVFLTGESGVAYSLLQQQLRKKNALRSSPAATPPGLNITLQNEIIKRRIASVDSSGVTAEYQLTLTVNYRISDATGKVVRPMTTLRIVRSYTFDQNDVVGKDKEELILRREMQQAAARQLLQQLQLAQQIVGNNQS